MFRLEITSFIIVIKQNWYECIQKLCKNVINLSVDEILCEPQNKSRYNQ